MLGAGVISIPILETERLRLRGHRVEDFADSAAMWGDPIVTRHIGGQPFTAEHVWSRILRYAGLWTLLDYGYWVIEERASGRFAGEVGFADFKRSESAQVGRIHHVKHSASQRRPPPRERSEEVGIVVFEAREQSVASGWARARRLPSVGHSSDTGCSPRHRFARSAPPKWRPRNVTAAPRGDF